MFLYSSVQFELFMLWMLCRCLCFISCMNVNIKYLLIFGKCFQRQIFLYMCYRYELCVYYLQSYICLCLSPIPFILVIHSFKIISFTSILLKFSNIVFYHVIPTLLICIVIQTKPIKTVFYLRCLNAADPVVCWRHLPPYTLILVNCPS